MIFENSLINVFLLSGFTILFGYILDFTISKNTLKYYMKEKPELYISGIKSTFFNLLIVSPINYLFAVNFIVNESFFIVGIQYLNLIYLLLCHNILYFILHALVHRVKSIRFIHNFHHKFKINLPSIGNAVSFLEFQFMYVLPFLVGLYLFQANSVTFNIAILIISTLSTIIHCNELNNIFWLPGFVSPKKHSNHHKMYQSHYSAPLLDFDWLIT